jgi:hypothetical protein
MQFTRNKWPSWFDPLRLLLFKAEVQSQMLCYINSIQINGREDSHQSMMTHVPRSHSKEKYHRDEQSQLSEHIHSATGIAKGLRRNIRLGINVPNGQISPKKERQTIS